MTFLDPSDDAAVARQANGLRSRVGVIAGVRYAQDKRDEHRPATAAAAFWSRVIAQLLCLERPAPEHANVRAEIDDVPAIQVNDPPPAPGRAQGSLF